MTPEHERLLELARERFAALDLPADCHGWLQAQLALSDAASEMRLDHQRVSGMLRRSDINSVMVWAWVKVGDVLLYLDRDTGEIEATTASDPRFEPAHVLTFSGYTA